MLAERAIGRKVLRCADRDRRGTDQRRQHRAAESFWRDASW